MQHMRPFYIVSLAFITAVLAGCAPSELGKSRFFVTIELPSHFQTWGSETVELIQYNSRPRKPDVRKLDEFKYGYFCGKNYPDIDPELPLEFRVKAYFSIKPYDSIDEACREHDLCWMAYGEGHYWCNRKFVKKIMNLRPSLAENRVELKCSHLINVMFYGFESIFTPEGDPESASYFFVVLRKAFLTVYGAALGAPLALLNNVVTGMPDPDKGEKCTAT